MNTDRLSTQLDTLRQASTDAADTIDVFSAIISELGYVGFVAAEFSVEERWRLLLYSSLFQVFQPLDQAGPWWSDDPVVLRLVSGASDAFRLEEAWANPISSAAERWDAMVEAGLSQGWVFPTAKRGFFGGLVLFSDPATRNKPWESYLDETQVLVEYCHAVVCQHDPDPDQQHVIRNTLGNRVVDGRKTKLAPREISCLRWCAFGKTADEIAYLEGVSVHTVRQYVKQAMQKLDATSQAQAVARGLAFGLFKIGPDPSET